MLNIVILLIWAIAESPRWIIRRGGYDGALEMLCYMLESSTSYATEEELELLNHLCQRKESVTTAPV